MAGAAHCRRFYFLFFIAGPPPFFRRSTNQRVQRRCLFFLSKFCRFGMGNAEVRALTQASSLVREELLKAHRMYLDYERQYSLDRSSFGLLFDASVVPFAVVDHLFDAVDAGHTGFVDFAELAVVLVSSTKDLELREKLDILFDAIDANGDGELTLEEVHHALTKFLASTVARIRGQADRTAGRATFSDRRCSSCNEVPVNVVYECIDCRRGYALGVPITTHLCKNCLEFEGYGCNSHDMFHKKTHRLVRSHQAPNPHVATHTGVTCSACDECPIVGVRYRCLQCTDFVNLCESCYAAGEEPRSHLTIHRVEAMERAPSLEDDVGRFIRELFLATDADGDGRVSREEFQAWGARSETASALLRGFDICYVRSSPYLECCSLNETVVTNMTAAK